MISIKTQSALFAVIRIVITSITTIYDVIKIEEKKIQENAIPLTVYIYKTHLLARKTPRVYNAHSAACQKKK